MQKFKEFIIAQHTFDPKTMIATFSYSFDHKVNFTETIDFTTADHKITKIVDPVIIDSLLFHLSLALAISYYKLYPTDNLYIENGSLDKDQVPFWKQFYINGLGEYFFTNKIKPFSPNFINTGKKNPTTTYHTKSEKVLVPIGGGKDSLVSIELIKEAGIAFDTITFGKDYPLHKRVSQQIGKPRLIINRYIDPLLFEMNKQGYYNGHVPISGIIAFVLTTVSYLYDYKSIIMSNEKSASEGNTMLDGIEINHQRAKSLEFELAFSKYIAVNISPDISYFSLLRGMYEIKITEKFCRYPQYFDTFSSCNRNFHINKTKNNARWCGVCPKCAFVYTLMSAFLPQKKIIQIFGKNMFADPSLKQLFQELLGISGIKPFECVGTNEEMILAMYKYCQQSKPETSETPIIKLFKSQVLTKMQESDFFALEKKLTKIYTEYNIPKEIESKFLLS